MKDALGLRTTRRHRAAHCPSAAGGIQLIDRQAIELDGNSSSALRGREVQGT
jgi:hypothetical protein